MSFVPLHLLSVAARRSVTVALTGDGGDELFAGYPTMAADWWHRSFDRLPAPVRGAFERGARKLPAALPEGLREFLRVLSYPPDARNQVLLGGMAAERHRSLLAPAVRPVWRDSSPTTTSKTRWRTAGPGTPPRA